MKKNWPTKTFIPKKKHTQKKKQKKQHIKTKQKHAKILRVIKEKKKRIWARDGDLNRVFFFNHFLVFHAGWCGQNQL